MTRRLPPYARPLLLIVGAYVLLFFTLAYRRWAVFGNDTSDFGYFNNMFWWTIRGRPFYASATGGSNLGVHTAFLWAQLIPFYWLFPGVPVLIFMQTLFLGICAWPMYLIARKLYDNHAAALLLATAFILLPPIVSQNVNQIEEPSFMAVYLLFTFYFFMTERFAWFMLFACLSCLGRENVPLAIAMFGVYALWQRRSWKWIILPPAVALPYFLLALYVIMPYFRAGTQWHVMRMFKYLGDTPGSIVMTALTSPRIVINHLLQQENIQYFVFLVQPLAWLLPFGSAESLMAAPDLAINLLSDNTALKVIPWHYNIVTGCFLFIGAMGTLRKLVGWLRRRYGQYPFEVPAAVGLVLLSVAHWFLWFVPAQYRQRPYHESLVTAIHLVPPDKSVIVPVRIQGHITSREHYDQLNYFVQNPAYAKQFEYVVLDANERQYPPIITQEFFDQFYKSPDYQLRFAQNGVFIFQRLGSESDWSVKPRTGGE